MSESQGAADSLLGALEIISGGAFSSAGFNDHEGLPLIRIRDLGKKTTEIRYRGSFDPAYLINFGDLLIGMDGDFAVQKWEGETSLLNQRVCKVVAVNNKIDQGFLYWYLKPHIDDIHRKTPQTTVRHLSTKSIFQISAPPVSCNEQVVVAEILDTLDTAIRETEAIIDKLKAVKQGLLHDLLTRGIDVNGELRPPQTEAPHLYKQSPLGWIPKEWECETVGSVIEGAPRNGIYKPVGDIGSGVLLVGQTAFTATGSVEFSLARRARVSSQEEVAFGLRAGDLLVSRVFATREGVGQPVLVPAPSEPAVFESNMMRLRVKPHALESKLLFHWLKHTTARTWIMSRAFASNQASINRETICNVPVPVPSMCEQIAILKASNGHESRIDSESLVLSKACTLKSGLMDDLLTGRVRVTPLLDN